MSIQIYVVWPVQKWHWIQCAQRGNNGVGWCFRGLSLKDLWHLIHHHGHDCTAQKEVILMVCMKSLAEEWFPYLLETYKDSTFPECPNFTLARNITTAKL